VMDHEPRSLNEQQLDTLQALANQVVSQLELRKAIREVRFAHLALKRQNEELEQFAYIASHDLNEPLRTVSSFTDLLKSELEQNGSEEAKQYLDFISEAAGRMTDLVSGLLDYSRIGRHRETHEIDCNELVKEVQHDLSAMIQECHAEIIVGELPRIHGNRVELRQLLQNLLSNAIKYSRPDVRPLVQIESYSDRQQWHIAVRDNGIGIEDSFQKRIFVIFQRLHSHNQIKGSGIGLAHCKKIIELHNGQIWVESTLGEGSTFHFTLPR